MSIKILRFVKAVNEVKVMQDGLVTKSAQSKVMTISLAEWFSKQKSWWSCKRCLLVILNSSKARLVCKVAVHIWCGRRTSNSLWLHTWAESSSLLLLAERFINWCESISVENSLNRKFVDLHMKVKIMQDDVTCSYKSENYSLASWEVSQQDWIYGIIIWQY